MRWNAVVALGAVGAVAACSSGSHASAPATSPTPSATPALSMPARSSPALPTADLRCAEYVGTDAPTADEQIVANAVALPSVRSPALGAAPTGDTGATRLFAKNGLLVRAGVKAELTVADPAHVSIGWGKPGPVTKRLIVPGCGRTGWLAFAGGFYVDQPRCITVHVTSGAEPNSVREDIRVGVGVACPGQPPPIVP